MRDPANDFDDFRQDYAITVPKVRASVKQSTFIRRREIDAARRYTRHAKAATRIQTTVDPSPIIQLISREQLVAIRNVVRRASPAQRKIAHLIMNGLSQTEIATLLHICPSTVCHALRRMRPLMSTVMH